MLTGLTLLPKPSFINQRLGWCNSVGDFDSAVAASGSSSGSGSGRLSFLFYQQNIWEVGVGQRRRGVMLSIQSKNWLKFVFSWFFSDMLTGWTLLPKPSFINQRLGWWNSVEDFDPVAVDSSSGRGSGSGSGSGSGCGRLSFFFFQPKIWEVGVGQRRTGVML